MRHPAVDRPPSIGGGYRVRNIEPGELADRVEVHRAAWKPALLPWHPDHRPVTDPEATSPFTRGHYDAVRRTWLYDPRLDLVVVAPYGAYTKAGFEVVSRTSPYRLVR